MGVFADVRAGFKVGDGSQADGLGCVQELFLAVKHVEITQPCAVESGRVSFPHDS